MKTPRETNQLRAKIRSNIGATCASIIFDGLTVCPKYSIKNFDGPIEKFIFG